MLIALVMLFISWQTHNNLWAYLALGLVVLRAFVQVGKEQQQKKTAELTAKSFAAIAEDATAQINTILKGMQAKNN